MDVSYRYSIVHGFEIFMECPYWTGLQSIVYLLLHPGLSCVENDKVCGSKMHRDCLRSVYFFENSSFHCFRFYKQHFKLRKFWGFQTSCWILESSTRTDAHWKWRKNICGKSVIWWNSDVLRCRVNSQLLVFLRSYFSYFMGNDVGRGCGSVIEIFEYVWMLYCAQLHRKYISNWLHRPSSTSATRTADFAETLSASG